MRPMQLSQKLGMVVAAFCLSSTVMADDRNFLHELYFNVESASARIDNGRTSDTAYGGGAAVGYYFYDQYFTEISANYLSLDQDDAVSVAKLMFGKEFAHTDRITSYLSAGAFRGDSSDIQQDATGYALSAGMTWGHPRFRFLAHWDYMVGGSDDDIDNAYLIGIGVRIQPGGNRQIYKHRKTESTSMGGSTACKEEYRELFPLCDKPSK